jgi:hypothetical protein
VDALACAVRKNGAVPDRFGELQTL